MSKIHYEWVALDSAINLLRPRAKWSINHGKLTWQDPRPIPTLEEIQDTIRRIKEFEDSIPYILLDDDPDQQYPDPAQSMEGVTSGVDVYSDVPMDGGGNGGKSGVPPTPNNL